MTKFNTFYNLCSIHDPNEFLGISSDREEGKIVTTLGKNIVVVIQISNQKQIRSWSTLEKLSTKVVFDRKSNKYVGVFANRSIRCWDEKTVDVNKSKKLKFQKPIADLVCYEETTLVIYTDGSCEELAAAIQSRKDQSLNANQQHQLVHQPTVTILNSKIFKLADGRKCLTFFEKHHINDSLVLVKIDLPSVPVENAMHEVKKFIIKRENLDVNVAGYAVIEGDENPMLLTIWSDKRLFLLNLNDTVTPEKSPGNFVSMLNTLKVDTPLSIIGVSKHFIAIYGANSSQEGGSLILYNTQFKVTKAHQFFKIYFNYSRLWTVDEHILLAMGQNLSVVSYRISKELLFEFIGTQSSNDFQTALDNDHINEEEMMQEAIKFASTPGPDITDTFSSNIVENNPVFADGHVVPFEAVTEFDKSLNALSNLHMHVDVLQVEKAHADCQLNLMSNIQDEGFSTTEVQLIASQLEKCGASEHEIAEKLLHVLMQANLLQDIAVCYRRYTNISEKILSKTLKYVLNNMPAEIKYVSAAPTNEPTEHMEIDISNGFSHNTSPTELLNADILLQKYQTVPAIKSHTDVLNVVLCCSFDTTAIATHIRRDIDYSQVLFLLEYLYMIMTSEHNFHLEMQAFGKDCIDLELQVFRWFGVFLNTHFQKLALSKDVRLIDILFKWHELFTVYKREIVELEEVAALLLNIVQRKKIFKEKNYSKWYSIEEVDLY